MEFIRSENAKPTHDPNTRHCLYGLDADLIMLGLCSHEPHFSLLREEVRFGGKKNQKRITAPEETTFHLLHLSLMREYIDYEFSDLRRTISFEYDLERIIDDWILMGFLVGNDFIPHLPHLHINHDALPLLYRTYITTLPSLGGYLNENGHLNMTNFEKYLEKLAEFDREHFREVFVDLKWFESKVGNKYLNEAAGLAAEEAAALFKDPQKLKNPDALCLAVIEDGCGGGGRGAAEEDGEDEDMFEAEFRQYKRTYYMTKMGVDVVSDDFLAEQARCYVEGIQWILHYYYHGVQSWSWYYPHHYAPFLSDVRNIEGLRLTFDLGKPFMPFEQLLGVLPAASKDLLPECYRHLMTSENSSIIEYYPVDFKTDLNGKQQEWEAVVLIPFIDERCLLAAMEPYNDQMSASEKARNRHTECSMYTYASELDYLYPSPLPSLVPHIHHCHVRQTPVPLDAWHVSFDHVGRRIDRGALYFCGFPTLQHIRHKFFKKKGGVLVFQQPSRGENTMLEILPQEGEPVCENVAPRILGCSVFVNWPHLEESRVVAVSDGETRFSLDEPAGGQRLYGDGCPAPSKVTYLTDKEQKDWVKDVQGITEHFNKRKGIFVNNTYVLVYVQPLTGRKYVPGPQGQVQLEKQWSKQVLPFPYQTVVKDIKVFDSSLTRFKTIEELLPPATSVFMVGTPYYGAMGEVQDSTDVLKDERVRVLFNLPWEPTLDALIQNQHKYSVKYHPGYSVASRLGITSYLVSRFTGSVFIGRGSKKNPHGEQRANVGLNLKFNKKNEEVPGYTKRTDKEWLYSVAVQELLAIYLERFSAVFDLVSKNSHDEVFYEDDIWPGEDENGAEKVQEITAWLKGLPVTNMARTSCNLQILDNAIVGKIEEEADKAKVKKTCRKVRVTVKPHRLFRPLQQQHGVVPDPDAEYQLFDRVVNVRESFSVPLGLRGTVIGIKGAERDGEIMYEVVFDEAFAGGLTIRCTPGRGYRLPPSALINLSHGCREEQGLHKLNHANKTPLAGLNHSPRSPFIPTQQQNGRQNLLRNDSQGNMNSSHKALSPKPQPKVKDEDFSNVWKSLQSAAPPQKPPTHWPSTEEQFQQGSGKIHHQQQQQQPQPHNIPGPAGSIRLLKRNEDVNSLFPAPTTTSKVSSEFEELFANLKIAKSNEQTPPPLPTPEPTSQSDGPLSPQSFAMKGTLVLKEMLKIDSSGTGSPAPQDLRGSAPSGSQQQNRKRPTKKLAARMGVPQADSVLPSATGGGGGAAGGGGMAPPLLPPSAMVPSVAAELTRICLGVGMAPPTYAYLHNKRQGVVVCQAKLSTGLVVHGPQCQTEAEAKEKAALFALQRLNSVGSSFPLAPPLFPGVGQMQPHPLGHMTPVFNQTGGFLVPPQGFGPVQWGLQPPHQGLQPPHHQGQPFYGGTFPGARAQAPSLPIGSHNQFVPLQVTKKRMSSGKKSQETREFHPAVRNHNQQQHHSQEATPSSTSKTPPPSSHATPDTAATAPGTPSTPQTPRQNPAAPASGHTPGSASKRKHRKLAVNFEAAKVTE